MKEKSCAKCHTSEAGKFIYVAEIDSLLCSCCYQRFKRASKLVQHELPPYGETRFDASGRPICHICGYAFKKVLSHAWQIHGLSGDEYKQQFGLFISKGICADETKKKLQKAVADHYDLVVAKNLIRRGQQTRFEHGSKGRTKEQVSEQLRLLLVARNKGRKPSAWVGRNPKKNKFRHARESVAGAKKVTWPPREETSIRAKRCIKKRCLSPLLRDVQEPVDGLPREEMVGKRDRFKR